MKRHWNGGVEFLPGQVALLSLLSWCLVHEETAWPLVQISNNKTVVSEGAGSPDQARQPQPTNYYRKASLTSTKHVCEISGFCRGAVEGYYALQLGSWLLTFRDVVPYIWARPSYLNDTSWWCDRPSRNAHNKLPT